MSATPDLPWPKPTIICHIQNKSRQYIIFASNIQSNIRYIYHSKQHKFKVKIWMTDWESHQGLLNSHSGSLIITP